MVAQPPFSMSERRSQEETLLNATSFATASVCCWNFSTQIGASAATTAAAARWVAIFSAVLPSVHPSCENPTTENATAPTTAPHTAGFTPGWIFISSPWLWETGTSPVSDQRGSIARGQTTKTASETTQNDALPPRLSDIGAAKKTDPNIRLCQLGWSDAPGMVTECEHSPMFATLRYRLACKSALYVAPDECYRQGERQARTRSSTTTQGALTVPSCQLHDLAA